MLKEHDSLFRKLIIGGDLLIIAAAFFVSYQLRNGFFFFYSRELVRIYPLETYVGQLPLLLVIWGSALYFCGAYEAFRVRSLSEILFTLTKSMLAGVILFASAAYLLKLHFLSRTFIVLIFIVSWLLLCAERIFLIYFLKNIRKKGLNFRNVLIVGTGPRAQLFVSMVQKHPELGLKIIGFVDEDADMRGQQISGYSVIGTTNDLQQIFEKHIVDDVIVIIPRSWLEHIENALLYCEQVGKRVSLAVDLFSLKISKVKHSTLCDFPLLTFQTTSDKVGQLLIKRFLDIVISAAALMILCPLFLFLITVIKSTSKGPVFFKQKRSSLNGRTFTLYKFRTMVDDAEKMLDSLKQHNEMGGPVFKMTDDPRVTPCGKWMRKFSLDELPQLWHILWGDMSIVGPRPPIPAEVAHYQPWQLRRLSMRPGLTCLWQIKGRNKIVNFDEWMKLDLQYIDGWSLWLDLQIFFKTIPVVLFAVGAK